MKQMNQVQAPRGDLFHELETGIRSTCHLLKKVKESDWSYRPADRMRSLKELASHLTAIPEADLAIMQEKEEDVIARIEKKYGALQSADQMVIAYAERIRRFSNVYDFPLRRGFFDKKNKAVLPR